MVARAIPGTLVAEAGEPLLRQLNPEQRAEVMMALFGIVLVGVALVAMALLWGRRMRRIARDRHEPSRALGDDWSRKPLAPREPDMDSTPETP